jgi:hypothetical protein
LRYEKKVGIVRHFRQEKKKRGRESGERDGGGREGWRREGECVAALPFR